MSEPDLIRAHGGLDPDPLAVAPIDWSHVPILALSMKDQADAHELRQARRTVTRLAILSVILGGFLVGLLLAILMGRT